MLTSSDIRARFLDYFQRQGHELVASSPLVPANDPTLLFTNAGMVQFKEVFLGLERRPYVRAATSQRCVRAGGKHNDLENVGFTARHHTFFEMLGNFSFGDYFKRDAIRYAWELLTVEFGLPPERLWVTVYRDDDEAADIWLREMGVDPRRFSRCGESDNFWSMGDTGPCGPCSEIFYDHGPHIAGGPPGSPDADGDRYVEIWNLVFMQFDRAADGTLTPLPRPSVDTGMGLERIAAVLQGVHSNYEIDLFRDLIAAVRALAGAGELAQTSLQVVADHIRSCAFLVADGVVPSNEGRGYVLRRIVRRAIRHGRKLGLEQPFFHRLVEPLERLMGAAYPQLTTDRERITAVLRTEEERFAETIDAGLRHLEDITAGYTLRVIPGRDVFKLYDTYGFPVDLTASIADEHGIVLDLDGFTREMDAQRERARAASHFTLDSARLELPPEIEPTRFLGYDGLEADAHTLALLEGGLSVEALRAGDSGIVLLDRTPFYAESGGQMGDRGVIVGASGRFEVSDTQKQGGVFLHIGRVVAGAIRRGERVECTVTRALREPTRRNHSATHLLHAALRRVLGTHVQQKGSLVAADRLRFDFSHHEAVKPEDLRAIEDSVNEQIRANHAVQTAIMTMDQATRAGALAFFGDKYGSEVRVLTMGDYSIELCGGTHVERTGDIGFMKIVSESGVAAGVRRIEALSGAAALAHVQDLERRLQAIASGLNAARDQVNDKVDQLIERVRTQDKEIAALKSRLAAKTGGDVGAQAVDVAGIKVLAARLDDADAATLRESCDRLRDSLGTAALVLGAVEDGKVRLVAGVTRDATDRLKAGDLVNFVAQQVGGKGGGRPDMAQAGGTDPDRLDAALASVVGWVRERLGA